MATVNILLDTDIGCDCDDAGALAVLHTLERQNEARILGITHTTSTPNGAACIDAINTFYGRSNIPVGQLADTDFLSTDEFDTYATSVADHFPCRYKNRANVRSAVALQREILAHQPPNSVILVAIGPLRNLARLLTSPPDIYSSLDGIELVRQRIKEVVIMGGCFSSSTDTDYTAGEYNISCDISSAQTVVRLCPVPIIFSGSEIGNQLLTGRMLLEQQDEHNPVWYSYFLHYMIRQQLSGIPEPSEKQRYIFTPSASRQSWDQTAVLYAVRGAEDFCVLSPYGTIEIADSGTTFFREDVHGKHRYIAALQDTARTRNTIDNLMLPISDKKGMPFNSTLTTLEQGTAKNTLR